MISFNKNKNTVKITQVLDHKEQIEMVITDYLHARLNKKTGQLESVEIKNIEQRTVTDLTPLHMWMQLLKITHKDLVEVARSK